VAADLGCCCMLFCTVEKGLLANLKIMRIQRGESNVAADLGCCCMLFCTVEKGLLARA
jgi:hypothetical protein